MRKELTAAHDAEHRTGTQSKADKVRIQCITEVDHACRQFRHPCNVLLRKTKDSALS